MSEAGGEVSASDQLIPGAMKLKKKAKIANELQPSDQSFQPTDLTVRKCTGFLHGCGVVVTRPEDVWSLVRAGSYGKGSFSRSIPCHNRVPTFVDLRRMSRKRKSSGMPADNVLDRWEKRIKLHSQWNEEKSSSSTSDEQRNLDQNICQSGFDDTLPCPSTEDLNSEELTRLDTLPSSTEESDHLNYEEFLTRLKEIKEKDPYVLDEYLHLCPEEAFYLVQELKVLELFSEDGNDRVEPHDLWSWFVKSVPSFPFKYAAYKHFRTGNWVPKSGLKFGVDFLLYKTSPLHFHSSYAVLVRENKERQKTTWKEVVTVTRACQATGKDLLICDVAIPESVDHNKPDCVHHCTCVDSVVKWWVPERDREM